MLLAGLGDMTGRHDGFLILLMKKNVRFLG